MGLEKEKNKPEHTSESIQQMATRLDVLQLKENDGRGVECIKSAVGSLRRGNLDEARRICTHDADKIINYPSLMKFVRDILFEGENEHPWSLLERLQAHSRER